MLPSEAPMPFDPLGNNALAQRLDAWGHHIIARIDKLDVNKAKIHALDAQIKNITARLQAAVEANQPNHVSFERNVAMAQSVDTLVADVAALDTVVDSAIALINGIAQRIADAITAALAGGATAAELAPLSALHTDLVTRTATLAAAVTANTPATP